MRKRKKTGLTACSGSGGSNTNSTSTGASHETPSSSRLSSASTVPSSMGGPVLDDVQASRQPPSILRLPITQEPEPESEPAFSIRAGSRTFSFGTRTPKFPSQVHSRSSGEVVGMPADDGFAVRSARTRALTESSYASTTTPPKLETDLTSSETDGFQNMFDHIGKRRSALMLDNGGAAPPDTHAGVIADKVRDRVGLQLSSPSADHRVGPTPGVSSGERP